MTSRPIGGNYSLVVANIPTQAHDPISNPQRVGLDRCRGRDLQVRGVADMRRAGWDRRRVPHPHPDKPPLY